jgi:hypothetical protein
LQDPLVLASSLYLKKPQRLMALLLVMTVCVLVYAALEYRIRHTLKAQPTTFPNQKGQPAHNLTACWVFQDLISSHLRRSPGVRAVGLHLHDAQQQLLRILGRRYEGFDS